MKAYVIADLLAHLEKEYLAQGKKEHAEALHRALSILRKAGCEDDDPISEPARGQLFPLLKRAGLSLDDLKEHLLTTYGITSSKAIPWGLFDEICLWLTEKAKNRRALHPATDQDDHPTDEIVEPLLSPQPLFSTALQNPEAKAHTLRHRLRRPRIHPRNPSTDPLATQPQSNR